jgi:hypothetical protein
MPFTRVALGLLTAVALTSASCGVIPLHTGYDLAEQRVMGSPVGGLGGTLLDMPIEVDIDAETAARDTGPAESVYLTSFTLSITPTAEPAGDTDDFDFVDSVEVFITGRAGSSLPRIRIASIANVPAGARTLVFAVEGHELLPYFREGAWIEATGTGTAPPDDVTYDGHLELAIEVL